MVLKCTRKDDRYIVRRMELPGRRKRGRPKWFMDAVREDMVMVEEAEGGAEDRTKWRWKIRCGDPLREKPNEEEYHVYFHYIMRRKGGTEMKVMLGMAECKGRSEELGGWME